MDGQELCADPFIKYVEVGDTLPINTVIGPKQYTPIKKKQQYANVKIFSSSDPNPTFVTDSNCQLIGSIAFLFKDTKGGYDRPISLKMTFGGTELAVDATEEKTGDTMMSCFEFLDQIDDGKT